MQPGDEVAGRYRLEELRGRGAMSEVWRAYDETLDRTVALKMLSPAADLERFRREGRSLAVLAHENVMLVFDYGEDPAGPFMALEWLPGGTLEDRLAHGALPPAETTRIASGLAAGLAHLHSRGVVHRDLKPANVLFDEDGNPKLGDFGLAGGAVGLGTITEAGTVLGTAAYISPEQAAGEPATPASDVYSFGVVLFRMLTGQLPFVAGDVFALADMHRHRAPPAVEELSPEAPPALAALAAASLRKDPAGRPADGTALLAALGAPAPAAEAVPGTEATAVMPGAAPGAARTRRRTAFATALLVLAAAGGALAWAVARPGPVPGGNPTGPIRGRHLGLRTSSGQPTLPAAARTDAPGTRTGRRREITGSGATTAPTTAPGTSQATTSRPRTTTVAQTTTAQTTTATTQATTTQPPTTTTSPTTQTTPTATAPTTTASTTSSTTGSTSTTTTGSTTSTVSTTSTASTTTGP